MTRSREKLRETFFLKIEAFQGVELLRELLKVVRPSESGDAERALSTLVTLLREEPEAAKKVHDEVRDLFGKTRLVHALAERGILSDVGFIGGLRARIAERGLPLPPREGALGELIRKVFSHRDDHRWIKRVSSTLWKELFLLLVLPEDVVGIPHEDLAAAALGLAQRAGALGIDEEINARLHDVEDYDSPFLCLTANVGRFLKHQSEETFNGVVSNLKHCRALIERLRAEKNRTGTSLRFTALTRRLLQQLRRVELLVHLIHPDDLEDFSESLVPIFVELVEAELTSRSIGRFVHDHADLLAFQITEHSAKKGAKYIIDSVSGYWGFLRAAMLGGAIVAIFALIKVFLGGLDLSLGGQAILYSFNYAFCFVLIYVTGAILATKQPAVTASAIAKCMDSECSREDQLEQVADTFVLVWRSQFISFVGNLICAFPVAILLAWVLNDMGVSLASQEKAEKLLSELHPFHSGSLFYAAIAGVFLFSAGIISAWVDNYVRYGRLHERLLHLLGRTRSRVADFVSGNLGMLAGNVLLGFFLGSAGTLGKIFGLPFDIRHIAFSSAHLGFSWFTLESTPALELLALTFFGVMAIGFVNFIISFGLTLFTTLESRRATFGHWSALAKILVRRVFKRPLEWHFPPRRA